MKLLCLFRPLLVFLTLSLLGQKLYCQTYFLNGDASFLGDDCYQLTPSFNFANGTVWYGDQLNLNEPFDIQFRMNLGFNDGNGADGICFVLHTLGTSAIGEDGGGMGYLGFNTSLGIEFDTYQNGQYGDPFEDHIAIQQNGDINHNGSNNIAGPVQMSPFSANTEDGDYHTVQITWNPQTQAIRVFFDCVFRAQGNVDLINEIFNGQNLVYWGFTAATGGEVNDQIVCLQENILSVGESVTICSGSSTILSAGASLDGSYQWTPAEGLNDPTSATPTASPSVNTTYTVTYTDLCGEDQLAEVDVVVDDLEVEVLNTDVLNCFNSTVSASAQTNFDNGIEYTWTNSNGTVLNQGLGVENVNIVLPGLYFVSVNYNDECFASEEFNVLGNFTTYPALPTADSVLNCNVSSVVLYNALVNDAASYEWSFDNTFISNQSNIETSTPGLYTLITTNPESGCTDLETFTLEQDIQVPFIVLPPQDTLNCHRRQIVLSNFNVTNTDQYEVNWTALTGAISSGSTTNSPIFTQPGLYQVVATSLINGCTNSANVEIVADEYFFVNLDELSFPNIITPNGDSKNEGWRPFIKSTPDLPIMDLFTVYNLSVFNRWGSLIDEVKRGQTWQPEFSDGTYYYILEFDITCEKNRREKVSGEITITTE